MKIIIKSSILFLFTITAISLTGCSNYAKFIYESSNRNNEDSGMTINKLKEDWRDYHVFYSGINPSSARGILFDPKDDDKVIIPDGVLWEKVEDESTLNELIHWTTGFNKTRAGLFRIVGANNVFFGYIWYSNVYLTTSAKIIDEKTLSIQHIMEPIGGRT